MTNQFPTSRFTFDPTSKVENTTIALNPETKKAAGEKPILTMLEKYGYMNIHMIKQGLSSHGHRTINADKNIRQMQEMGLVNRYTIMSDDPDVPKNDVYVLSGDVRVRRGIAKAKRIIHDYNMANVPQVLEKMALCQWHLKVTRNMNGKEVMFNKHVQSAHGRVYVPSLVRVKTRLKKHLYLCGVPVAKGRNYEHIGAFVMQIVFLTRYFAENRKRFPSCVLVILCESERQIEDVSRLMGQIRQTRDLYLLYAIDSIVGDDEMNPLEMLYSVSQIDSSPSLDLVKIA